MPFIILRVSFVVLAGLAGFVLAYSGRILRGDVASGILVGIGFGLLGVLIEFVVTRLKLSHLISGLLSIVGAVIVSNVLLLYPFFRGDIQTRYYVATVLLVFYTMLLICYAKREEIDKLFVNLGLLKEKDTRYKILDTSAIIDGRIADIAKIKFLEGELLIPKFVLAELQQIADSSDALKRNRGRRGLDILNRIQKEIDIPVRIVDTDFPDLMDVDSKLIKLGQHLNAKVITNDFNLNKIAQLQNVPVLNINDLANALKPVVLPGEALNITIIKDGKEANQGVGYLDDGTMVVVDNGRRYIGSHCNVIITSTLQTSAGRMIFGKLADRV